MSTPTPDPADPRGGTAPTPDLEGRALLDGGADEAEGTAAEDMADAARGGDARLREAEQSADLPDGRSLPQQDSAGRGSGAGAEGGPDVPGQ
jgi:hypothetical protein